MKLVNKENDVFCAANLVHDRLDPLLELAAIFCASHHQCEIEGDDLFITEKFGHLAGDDFLGKTFSDGCLANARFTDEDGLFLVRRHRIWMTRSISRPADDRIEFILLGKFGEVATEGARRPVSWNLSSSGLRRNTFALFLGREVWIELLEDFVSGAFNIDFQTLQDARGNTFPSRSRPRRICSVPT